MADVIPRANFTDPLLQERGARRLDYFKANLLRPLTLLGFVASGALAFLHPYLVPAGWVAVVAAAFYFAHQKAGGEWWLLLLDHLGFSPLAVTEPAPLTPLLRSGDERKVLRAGADAHRQLFIFRSTDVRRDREGKRHEDHHDFTVVVMRSAAPSIRFLSAHEHRFGPMKFLGDDLRGKVLRGVERFTVESVELADRFTLRSSTEDGARARQIFKPSFIVWFTRSGVPFEYEDGDLVVFVDRVLEHAEEFKVLLSRAAEIELALRG